VALIVLQMTSLADVVAYWRFEDGTGLATDETGQFDGELTSFYTSNGDAGPEGWSTNVMGALIPLSGAQNTGSIRFGGASAFVDISNSQDMLLGSSFTIEFLVNPDDPGGGVPVFGLSPINRLYTTLGWDAGQLIWWTQFQDQFSSAPADLVQIGEWQHVAFVVEPTEYTIYVNRQIQFNGGIPAGGEGPFNFPGSNTTGDRTIGDGFRGYLDEVRISDAALTPDQFLIVPEPTAISLLVLGGLTAWFSNGWKKRRRNFQ